MIKERRKYPRAKTKITPGEFFTIRINDVLKRIGDIENLSAGGVAVETDNEFEVGDEVFISFRLPGHLKLIDGLAKVVRTNERVLGIKFLEIDPMDEIIIKMFVKKESDKEGHSIYSIDLSKIK